MTELSRLETINRLSLDETQYELLKCCGSRRWALEVAKQKPFTTVAELKSAADAVWWSLNAEDWLEAFRSHPKIGERKTSQPVSSDANRWSAQEQSGISSTPPATLEQLADLNKQYEEKFGYIFIVCASGKSAEEMLALLRERINNAPETELKIAAGEQAKITALRIEKLLNQ